MAMVELAARSIPAGSSPATLADIAACQQLSLCYLEQLFIGLRRAGLVVSARGPGGGYRLARAPSQISIAEVLAAVDEPLRATRCDGATTCLAGGAARCRTHDLWEALGRHLHSFLGAVTLADVLVGDLEHVSPEREPAEALA